MAMAMPILGVTDSGKGASLAPAMSMPYLALAPALAGGGGCATPPPQPAKLGLKAMVARQTTTSSTDKVEDMAEAAARKLLLERIKTTMQKDLERIVDLFRRWDTGGDGTVDRAEFGKAVALLGFAPPDGPTWGAAYAAYTGTIDALFAALDEDGSGGRRRSTSSRRR